MPGRRFIVCAVLALAPCGMAWAAPQPDTQLSPLTIRMSVKATGLASRFPADALLFPRRTSSEGLLRLRLEPEIRANRRTLLTFAYDQRYRYTSAPAAALFAGGILPSHTDPPYRLRPLVWRAAETSKGEWRHEIDRANVQLALSRVNLTAGRQVIGWGRGVMFTAVDLFAPFSPLEVDREWRLGIDALRADIRLADRTSLDLVAAFGRTVHRSVFAARARGYAGPVDVEVVGGRRARDLFGGVSSSAAVGPAEVHGELAAFRVPATSGHEMVWKIVAGGSYRVPVGAGVLVFGEYHYSGFGSRDPGGIPALLSTPAFVERYARGDTQMLSRHLIGLALSYESSPEVSYATQVLLNPLDRSGIFAPALTYTFNDAASVHGAIYIPYGRAPEHGRLRSEYGAASLSGLIQCRMYF